MFIQTLYLHVPQEGRDRFQEVLHQYYVPVVRQCDGFLSACALEEGDDAGTIRLMTYWYDRASCERVSTDGTLTAAYLQMAAAMPGLEIKTWSGADHVPVASHDLSEPHS